MEWDKIFVVVQSLTYIWLFATPWTAACQASLSLLSPGVAQTHVHWVGDAVQPSHPLSSPSPPAFNLPSIRIFSNESSLRIRWPKYCSFNFSISPSNEYSGLISIRKIGLISLQSKGLSRVYSNTTVQKHQFFSTQPSLWSDSHIHTSLLEKPQLFLNGPLLSK